MLSRNDSHDLTKPERHAVPRLGVLGGGQLAKMTALAAAQMGCEVFVLERQPEFPADSLDTHSIIADWDDPQQLLQLGSMVDVVTLENEFVSIEALEALSSAGHIVRPTAATMKLVRDKYLQKLTLADFGLPVPRFSAVPDRAAARRFGFPAVLKKRCHSYDGKGNATVRTAGELDAAWARLDGDHNPLYVEELCALRMELAVIVTRAVDGDMVCYPVVETVNRDHICHVVKVPSGVPEPVATLVADMARRATAALCAVGGFGIEFFLCEDGRVLVNEIAPRVHNTGHYTIEACVCSQFENHLRAVMGWPLGLPEMRAPAAAMVNLLGSGDGPGTPFGLFQALSVPGAHVHVYGKARSARGRKMGHVTALGPTADAALATASKAANYIRFGE
ncbi:MAG: 5-(carboxyamino)imidazole ribonucleotide synthase [Planctomycetes bacterium]|nr:5-(carboxyamino)imidazole ribonucleotide synthase [Planctomycetota bacterium]